MLINKMGVESDDEIIDLNSRREVTDPKNRVTMTMLLQVAMDAVPRSERFAAPITTDSPISQLDLASDDEPDADVPHMGVA